MRLISYFVSSSFILRNDISSFYFRPTIGCNLRNIFFYINQNVACGLCLMLWLMTLFHVIFHIEEIIINLSECQKVLKTKKITFWTENVGVENHDGNKDGGKELWQFLNHQTTRCLIAWIHLWLNTLFLFDVISAKALANLQTHTIPNGFLFALTHSWLSFKRWSQKDQESDLFQATAKQKFDLPLNSYPSPIWLKSYWKFGQTFISVRWKSHIFTVGIKWTCTPNSANKKSTQWLIQRIYLFICLLKLLAWLCCNYVDLVFTVKLIKGGLISDFPQVPATVRQVPMSQKQTSWTLCQGVLVAMAWVLKRFASLEISTQNRAQVHTLALSYDILCECLAFFDFIWK